MVPTLRVVTPPRTLRVHAACQTNRFRHRVTSGSSHRVMGRHSRPAMSVGAGIGFQIRHFFRQPRPLRLIRGEAVAQVGGEVADLRA